MGDYWLIGRQKGKYIYKLSDTKCKRMNFRVFEVNIKHIHIRGYNNNDTFFIKRNENIALFSHIGKCDMYNEA